METDTSQIVNERMAHWHNQGVHGAAVYDALATDTALPVLLDPEDIEAISGDTPRALRARRSRGKPPAFIKGYKGTVRYPRFEYFQWLKARFVPRSERDG